MCVGPFAPTDRHSRVDQRGDIRLTPRGSRFDLLSVRPFAGECDRRFAHVPERSPEHPRLYPLRDLSHGVPHCGLLIASPCRPEALPRRSPPG